MLPNKKGEGQKQQITSLGIYFNVAGINSAEKQAQKLSSQIALNEFFWSNWSGQTNNVGSVGYWVSEFAQGVTTKSERLADKEFSSKTLLVKR